MKELVKQCGDTLEVREYTRLSELVVEETHVRSFADLREGDCIVAFTRQKCFEIRNQINKAMTQME